MGGLCNCISATFFSILTIGTIGITAIATTAIFILVKLKKLDVLSHQVYVGLTVALVVVLLIFLFAIYASCCGRRCAKFILFILYLLYAIAFAALGVVILVKKDAVVNEAERFWLEDKYEDTYKIIEKAFNCECWNATLCGDNESHYTPGHDCQTVLGNDVHKYWKVIIGVTFGFAGLIFLGAACACGYACCRDNHSGEGIMYANGYRRYR